jgi:hypothetical protein
MVIQGNTLYTNDLGIIIFSGSPTLLANNFSYHGEAVRVEGVATPTAHFNSFIGTRKWAWKHLCPNDVDAIQNWWGTAHVDSINSLIYDRQDDSLAGTVDFEPFLTSPLP